MICNIINVIKINIKIIIIIIETTAINVKQAAITSNQMPKTSSAHVITGEWTFKQGGLPVYAQFSSRYFLLCILSKHAASLWNVKNTSMEFPSRTDLEQWNNTRKT